MQKSIQISTPDKNGLYDITRQVEALVAESGVQTGLVNVYVQGATAGIMIQENWDQSVQNDVIALLRKLVPAGVWEHDAQFLSKLQEMTCIGIDMETATLFIAGHYNEITRGALLLVSDVPITPDGVKTEELDTRVTQQWAEIHLQIGIEAMMEIGECGEQIRHLRY